MQIEIYYERNIIYNDDGSKNCDNNIQIMFLRISLLFIIHAIIIIIIIAVITVVNKHKKCLASSNIFIINKKLIIIIISGIIILLSIPPPSLPLLFSSSLITRFHFHVGLSLLKVSWDLSLLFVNDLSFIPRVVSAYPVASKQNVHSSRALLVK